MKREASWGSSISSPVGITLFRSLGKVFRGGFASCDWSYISFLNYEVSPQILSPYLPAGTELDLFKGTAWLSLIGLVFRNTKIIGLRIPSQQNYQQVNLRFYVKRTVKDRVYRGVAFIRELVPKRGLALAARMLYNERYSAVPVRRKLTLCNSGIRVQYRWHLSPEPETISLSTASREPQPIPRGSLADFLVHRFRTYTPQPNGSTAELRVRHPRWEMLSAQHAQAHLIGSHTFGADFTPILANPPDFAFLASGSAVQIYEVKRFRP